MPGWQPDMALRKGLLYLLAQLLPAVMALFTLAFYTRQLSTEDYGRYGVVMVTAAAANILLFNWLYVGVYRFWHDGRLPALELQRVVVLALLAGSGLVVVLGGAWISWQGQAALVMAVVALLICGAWFGAYQRVNAILGAADQYLYAELGRTLLAGGLGVGLVWLGFAWGGAIAGNCLGFALVLLGIRRFYRYFAVNPLRVSAVTLRRLLRYGLPLSLTFMLLEVIHASDRLLLGSLSGMDEAGRYTAAMALPQQLLIMAGNTVSLTLYPQIIQVQEQQGVTQAAERLSTYLLVLAGLLVPVWAGLIAIRQDLLPLLVGEAFLPSALQLVPLLGLAMLLNALYLFYVSFAFQLSQHTGDTVWLVLAAALLNLGLNLWLIPRWGALGAAWATLLAYALCVLAGYGLGRRRFPLRLAAGDLLKILLAAGLMYGLLTVLPLGHGWLPGLLRIVLGVLSYALLLVLLDAGGIRRLLGQAGWRKQLEAAWRS
ncbi:MAG: lipopolysaccharide biosynthesis protein [Thiolinea sp.]